MSEPTTAERIYDILRESAGAPETWRRMFTEWFDSGYAFEFRFEGLLGFGGKFYRDPRRWRVGCYPEDRTPKRDRMISDANTRLASLLDEVAPTVAQRRTGRAPR